MSPENCQAKATEWSEDLEFKSEQMLKRGREWVKERERLVKEQTNEERGVPNCQDSRPSEE